MTGKEFKRFFNSDSGEPSMSRLLCFLSFFPATTVLFILRTETALVYYLGAYVVGYIGSKSADAWSNRK